MLSTTTLAFRSLRWRNALLALGIAWTCTAIAEAGAPSSLSGAPPIAGLVAHVDPDSGELLRGGANAEDPELDSAQFFASSEGLVEETLDEDMGFRVRLEGRFRHPVIARLDANGIARVDHGAPVVALLPAPPLVCRMAEPTVPVVDGGAHAIR